MITKNNKKKTIFFWIQFVYFDILTHCIVIGDKINTQPSECGQQRTLNSVHGHTAAQLQSNGNLAV